ncbi:MAG: hypothetical protein JNG84_15300 [Archangium sp.]|nr:hypothetical protein [Archangium sp.]
MYPSRFSLPELTAHLVALLERRRAGLAEWSAEVEHTLRAEAAAALTEAEAAFREVADDAVYWRRVTDAVHAVALPRYLALAKAQHALERAGYGAWRKGDFISRVAYGAAGLLVALVVWRTPIPDWFEPVPVAFFLFGPLLPDAQAWWAKRRFATDIAHLVEDMGVEQRDTRAYQPVMPDTSVEPTEPPVAAPQRVKD